MCSKGVSCKKIEDCDELYGTRSGHSVLHLRSGKCRCNVTERVQHAAVISLKSTFTLNERASALKRAVEQIMKRGFFSLFTSGGAPGLVREPKICAQGRRGRRRRRKRRTALHIFKEKARECDLSSLLGESSTIRHTCGLLCGGILMRNA